MREKGTNKTNAIIVANLVEIKPITLITSIAAKIINNNAEKRIITTPIEDNAC